MAWVANRDEEWTRRSTPGPNTVCISITDPMRRAALPNGFLGVLRLQFDDLTEKYGPSVVLCGKHDAKAIVEFARKHRGRNILVHCAAGICRSGAVVEAILAAFPEYVDRGGRAHGWPRSPNPLVLRLVREAFDLPPLSPDDPRMSRPPIMISWYNPYNPRYEQTITETTDAGTDADGSDCDAAVPS